MGADKLHPLLLPGGEISEKELLTALELPVEQWPRVLSRGKNGGAIQPALEEFLSSGRSETLEQRMDEALLTLAEQEHYDSFGIGPLAVYLLTRRMEAKKLRILFADKRAEAGLPQ
jgi:vacuolar-type H+-ATPase subunit C/Vma6